MNGGFNLFTSHFIIGCTEVNRNFTLTETDEIDALHKLIEFKDNDPHMTKYRTRNTLYISYLRIIPIEDFREILEELKTVYRKKYPYSEPKDFIKHHFEGTIFELKRIVENSFYFTWMSEPPNENKYTYYTYFSHEDRENIDFGILNDYDIDYYTQYYQRVIDLIENTTFNESKEVKEIQTPFTDPKTHELFNYIVDKWNYDKDLKYAYIFNYLVDTLDFTIIETDYEKYIRTKYNIGRVYYQNANSEKRIKQIEDIITNYNHI